MPTEIMVHVWDDLDFANGTRTPAEPSNGGVIHKLSLDGKTVKLSLTQEHSDGLKALLARYFEVGEDEAAEKKKPFTVKNRPQVSHKDKPGPPGLHPGNSYEHRVFYVAMREWADQNGYPYKLNDSGYYYPRKTREAFAAYLAEESAQQQRGA